MKTLLTKLYMLAVVMGTAFVTRPTQANLVTIGAVHDYVYTKWDIAIPYSAPSATNLISMRYLMQLVDIANEKLNGFPNSAYASNKQYATSEIATTTAAIAAVDTLIRRYCPDDLKDAFCFVPATNSNEYGFRISAAGNYVIDWGDGNITKIEKTDADETTYSHTYAGAASEYGIILKGKASAYSKSAKIGAVSFFYSDEKLRAMYGCLGCIFSTIDDESVPEDQRQPRFYYTFQNNAELITKIPENLFNGIHGQPVSNMFYYTFYGCAKLPDIPKGLFSGVSGAPARSMFTGTFENCYALTGTIAKDLFAGLQGPPAVDMFHSTFKNCRMLNGPIPEDLFAGITGDPQSTMFQETFSGCLILDGKIPENLFAGISPARTYQSNSFFNTFAHCGNLTGFSPKIDNRYLYEIWPDTGQTAYVGATKLSDYDCIPANWGGAGTRAPGECDGTMSSN